MDFTLMLNFGAALFAVVNPLGDLPIFVSFTSDDAKGVQWFLALFFAAWIAGMLLLFLFTGEDVLRFFGIGLPAFRIAGGIVLFAGPWTQKALGNTGLDIATRVPGLFLAAMGVQFMIDGIASVTVGLIKPVWRFSSRSGSPNRDWRAQRLRPTCMHGEKRARRCDGSSSPRQPGTGRPA